jgi:hypothetical protein
MGALTRATKSEVEELSRGDPDWWPTTLARIANGDSLRVIADEGAWAVSGLWAWMQADVARVEAYDAALKARAQMLAFEAIEIADSAVPESQELVKAKLRVSVREHFAGKWDRGRYGDRSEVEHKGAIGLSLMTVLASLPRAGAIAERDVTAEALTAEAEEV